MHFARRRIFIISTFFILMLLLTAALFLGSVAVSPRDTISVMANHIFGTNFSLNQPQLDTIVWQIRLPRVILGLLAGMALATCGVLLQGVLKNPLADPYILGTSAGGSVGAVAFYWVGLNFYYWGINPMALGALTGALIATVLVWRISYVKGRSSPGNLILSGVAVSAFLSAILSFLIILSEGQLSIYFWLMGKLSAATWDQVYILFFVVVLGLLTALISSRRLDGLLLGDEIAMTMGIDVEKLRGFLIVVAGIVAGFTVAFCGMIGFVGLIVPHMVRLIAGSSHRALTILSALLGAILLVLADVLSRTLIPPQDIPVGIVTAVLGAPFFLYLLHKGRGIENT